MNCWENPLPIHSVSRTGVTMAFLQKLDLLFAKIETWLTIALLWGMAALTFLQVCLRALYTHGHIQWANSMMGHMDWLEPFTRLLLLWLTFLGAALVTHENRHIRIDLFGALLPEKWLPMREVFLSLACVCICGVMAAVSTKYVFLEMQYGEVLFAKIPSWAGEIIFPVGFFLILFHFMVRTVFQGSEVLRRRKK